jgi:uncharacterized protein (TIGR00730 family)
MNLCFIGSGIEVENTAICNIEIRSIINVLIRKYQTLIFGGSNIGLMGEFAKCYKEKGGRIISIVPNWLKNQGLIFDGSDEVIDCKSIIDRKNIMFKMCDDIICYPGGLGTIDELFTCLALDSLEPIYKTRSIYIYNHQKYYSPLLLQIEIAKECGLIKKELNLKIKVFEYAEQLIDVI